MANADIWMPLYIGDYLAATTHLSATESGGYLHLLMHQWKNGKLPDNSESLRRIARIEIDAWSNAWAMLESFFDHAQGFPVQMRLEEIRAEWLHKKESATEKAEKAAAARWSKSTSDASSIPQAMPHPCPSSSSSPTPKKEQKPKQPQAAFALPVGIDRSAWDGYEEMRKKKRCALTDHGRDLCLKKLESLKRAGHDPTEVLNQSTMHGWQGLFEVKGASNGTNRDTLGNRKADAASTALSRAQARIIEADRDDGSISPHVPEPGGGDGRDSLGRILEATL